MLDAKVIVVAGGAGLLGRVFATAIAREGGIAVVADVDRAAANRIAAEIAASGLGDAEGIEMDITDTGSVRAAIDGLKARHGRIDAVVNSAYPRNSSYGRKLEDVTYEAFCENVNLHLGGYFLVAQQFGMHFRENGGGNIVNMASVYGTMPPRFGIYAGTKVTMPVEYAAIKSAVIQLTRYFAQYFKGCGIRVNCLSPGGILDNQTAEFLAAYNAACNSKGMLNPQDVAGTLVYLLSDASRFVTGQNVIVDDGFSL